MSEEAPDDELSKHEPQIERWLRDVREKIKKNVLEDLQVLVNQLSNENKDIRKRLARVELELREIKKILE